MSFCAWRKVWITVVALIIYGLTSFAPLVISMPTYIQMNIITVFLITLVWGGPVGILFVVLISVVNNNLANGGGIILYALFTKIFEVMLIALVNWQKKFTLLQVGLTSLALIMCVKPMNLLLYRLLSQRDFSELSFVSFFTTEYLFYLSHSLQNYGVMVVFSGAVTWGLVKIFFNYLGDIKICNDSV